MLGRVYVQEAPAIGTFYDYDFQREDKSDHKSVRILRGVVAAAGFRAAGRSGGHATG